MVSRRDFVHKGVRQLFIGKSSILLSSVSETFKPKGSQAGRMVGNVSILFMLILIVCCSQLIFVC